MSHINIISPFKNQMELQLDSNVNNICKYTENLESNQCTTSIGDKYVDHVLCQKNTPSREKITGILYLLCRP